MKSFTPTSSFRNSRAFLASLLTCLMLVTPLTPLGFAATTTQKNQSKSSGGNKQQPVRKDAAPAAQTAAVKKDPPVVPNVISASDISANKVDTILNDTLGDGKAQAGDTIRYDITITNNSATDPALNVTLNDIIDGNTTLVPNSINAQPQARNDSYTTVGNTLLKVGVAAGTDPEVVVAGSVFGNDANATSTSSFVSNTQPANGTLTFNTDGTFTYLPNANFRGPTDTFTYTVKSDADNTLTDTATVTINITSMVWYVDNSYAGANGAADGRSNRPFTSLTPVNNAASDVDLAGDYIYIFQGSGPYTTGLVLENNQLLVGNGVALVVPINAVPTTLRAAGTRPTLNNGTGNALTLANNVSAQGLNLTAAANAGIFGSGISGTNNVSDANVTTTGSGTAVSLTNQAGTFNYSGGGGSSISGNSSGTAVLISGGGGNITFFGVPVSQNNGRAVDIQNRTGGTVEFSNGSTVTQTAGSTDSVVLRNNATGSVISFLNNVNLTTASGRGLQTDNSSGSFTLNMNAAGNNINATGGAAIDVEDIAADLDFVTLSSTNSTAQGIRIFNLSNSPVGRSVTVTTSTTVNNSAGTGVLVDSNAAAVSFATLNSAPAANQIGVSIVSNTGATSATGGTVTTTDAVAVNVLNSLLNMTLASVSTDNTGDADRGVSLDGLTGSLTMSGGSIVGGNAQAFYANGQNGSITYNGTISQSNASRLIEVTNKTGGTVAFGGAVSSTSGTGTGILLNSNTGATINFTGGIALTTNANPAFTATSGGTVSATQNNTSIVNTLTTTTGVALNVSATNIGAGGLTFRSISSNGASNGIVLNSTGAAGGLTVTGNSSGACGGAVSGSPLTITTAPNTADCTGGTIQSSTGAGILLTSTSNVSLTRMRIINGGNDGVFGTTVTGFTLASSLIDNNGNAVEEAGLDFTNLHGTSSVTNSTIRLSHENNIEVRNNTVSGGQATLTVTGCAITNASAKAQSDDGILYEMAGTSNGSLTADGNVFTANRGDHVQAAGKDTSALRAIIKNNNLTGGHSTALGQDIVVNGAAYTGAASVLYDISGNTINGAILSAITTNLGVPSNSVTMSGHVRNNVIGTTGVIRSCSTQAHGIAIDAHGAGTHTASVTGNTMRQCKDRGINVTANDSIGGNLFLTVQSNTVLEGGPINPPGFPADGTGSREAFNLIAGSTASDTIFICAQIGGAGALANNFNRGTEAIISGLQDIRIRKQSTAVMTIRLPGYAGSATDASAFVAGNNTSSEDGASTATAIATSSGGGGGGFVGGAACSLPPANPLTGTDEVILQTSSATNNKAADAATTNRAVPVASDLTNPAAPVFIGAPRAAAQPMATGEAQAQVNAQRGQDADKETSKSAADKGGNVQPLQAAFPVIIPTLQPGESVTITFQVTVNTNIPNNVTSVSNQGSITSTSFAGTVLTNDPSTGAANDPTVTDILPRPSYTINNASIQEPSTGSVNMPFTVALSYAYGSAVSVNFQTADGTATVADGDYTPTSGTLNFAAGQLLQTISVPVLANGDTSDETFTVTLSTPVNSVLGANSTATGTILETSPPGRVLISEVRTSGPNGAGDDFVELYNNQDVSQNISGWAIFKSGASCLETPVLVAVIPAATTLPPRGHYLIVGPNYNAANFSGTTGNPTVAAVADIEADRNLALFNTSNVLSLTTATREDAVAFSINAGGGNNCDLLREGATLLSANGSASQYSFARNLVTGLPKETNDNAADFLIVSTTPAVNVGDNLTPVLGAPGPENLAAPIQRNAVVKASLIDGTVASTAPPNRVRSSFGANPTNAAFGTLSIQRRFKNTLAVPVTRLRFRIVDLTTINNRPPGSSDLRVLSSTGAVINSAGATVVTVTGLTLEGPPQPNGGGLNSTLTVIPPGGALAAGASIDVQFLLGVQEQGQFSFFVNVEALPAPAGGAGPLPGADLKNGSTGKQVDPASKPDDQQ